MPLKPSIREYVWVARFADHLRQLLKSLSPEKASQFASQTFGEASDLEPEEAAEIFATGLPPIDVGAPGD